MNLMGSEPINGKVLKHPKLTIWHFIGSHWCHLCLMGAW